MVQFTEISAATPTYESVQQSYQNIHDLLDGKDYPTAFDQWNNLRRVLGTWGALVYLRFSQDTQNEDYQKAREYCDELSPRLTDLEILLKKRLLAAPECPAIEALVGSHAFRLWQSDVATFDPAIQDDLVEESRLSAQYTALLASAQLEFQGETVNLSGLRRYAEHPDRTIRYQAQQVRWQFFAEHQATLDTIFHDLVQVRDRMAKTLGYENYIGLGYRRMQRIDYDQQDVERYRQEVVQEVVPLAAELHALQAKTLGLDQLFYWDEDIFDLKGNPAPHGDHDWLLTRAQEMFDGMGEPLGNFFRLMVNGGYLDLKNRPSKAGGGFCTSFPTVGMPYIFANFNGTKGDVDVFTHEMGHAFQGYQSRALPMVDYLWPTMESCEIHSMSLEFLTWPQMEKFFDEDADRYRRIHLTEALLFLPYGVAVDHFQHLVYSNPTASPAERNQMWREMEAKYLPWRNYGDLGYPQQGGLWQGQQHIYNSPFYYIDYTLAGCCALQFWAKARHDYTAALEAYVQLCARGGSAPFQELVASAGLVSPFAPGALHDVVTQARGVLLTAG